MWLRYWRIQRMSICKVTGIRVALTSTHTGLPHHPAQPSTSAFRLCTVLDPKQILWLDNMLKHAPHTADVMANAWTRTATPLFSILCLLSAASRRAGWTTC